MRENFGFIAALALAACSASNSRSESNKLNTFDVEEPTVAPVGGPQIAYAYTLAYTLSPDNVAKVQARHLALCRSLGPSRCFVAGSQLSRDEDGLSSGTAAFVVSARIATAFSQRLDASAVEANGLVTERNVSAEDLTKQIIDTDAKARAKQALADRLLGLIRGARGSVADLVAAERAYAEVQEQLDAARTLQSALRRRVATSSIDVTYGSEVAGGTLRPLSHALSGAGTTFAGSLAAIITFVVAAVPWLLVGVPLMLALRWLWRRRRSRLWSRLRPPPA